MKWDCRDCNWTGDDDDVANDGVTECCPRCNGDVDVDLPERDPLDDENQTFRNVEVSALCAEWNL